jgi:HSP20 family protein
MAFDLMPRSFFQAPRFPSLWEDDEDWKSLLPASGLTVSEDEKQVFVEAAVPGVDPDKIEVTYDKGILWIRGNQEEKEEDKGKKFYRKASSAFSYRIAIPGNIDDSAEPQATCKNGVMKVTFSKVPETQPKKLTVKTD